MHATESSLLDSLSVTSISMIIFIIISHGSFNAHMNITVLYHKEMIEATSASQVLNKNEMIYSNEMQTVIFFSLQVEYSA